MLCRAKASNVSHVGLDVAAVSVLFFLTGGVSFCSGVDRARGSYGEPKGTPPSLVYTPADLTSRTVATVLKDLAPKCDPATLIEVADVEATRPHVQRLGYLLDVVGAREFSEPLARWVAKHGPDWVRLQPGRSARRARRERRWRLLVNTRVEPDI